TIVVFFSSRIRHTRSKRDWSSDVCSSDLIVAVDIMDQEELVFSENHACPICGFSIGELEPRLFSFNSPFGACPTCDGLGTNLEVDLNLVIPDWDLSLNEHAIDAWKPISSQYY